MLLVRMAEFRCTSACSRSRESTDSKTKVSLKEKKKKKTLRTTVLSISSGIVKISQLDLQASATLRQKQNMLGRMLYESVLLKSKQSKTARLE